VEWARGSVRHSVKAFIHRGDNYYEIQTRSDDQSVTATVDGGTFSLADYILGTAAYPFKRAYDITQDGLVTPSD